jgi:uncharacterized coiled-coil protein SlyX
MRKSLSYSLGAVIIILLAASGVLFAKYRKTTADYNASKASEEASQARYAQTIDAIAEIQDSLNAISVGDTSVQMISRDLAEEKRLGQQPNNEEAMERIAVLRSVVLRSKERIRELEASLSKSGHKVKGLEKMIAGLKKSVADKETAIAQLTEQVNGLQTQVTDLNTTVQENQVALVERDSTIEEHRKELATVYVAVGNKKELQQQGVIVAKGGVLGMGKSFRPANAPVQTAFTPLDTDQETVIRTQATKLENAKVLSAQPAGSYELVAVDGHVELHILDPKEFRKIRQLVIVTA